MVDAVFNPENRIKPLTDLHPLHICDTISRDNLFDGELICYQHQKGYRFSVDSVLLAHFVEVRQQDRILDLGTGSGIISMILLYRWRDRVHEVCGIEIQQGLADLARKNFQANDLEGLGNIMQGDIKKIGTLTKAEAYDRIVCNPPFYSPISGRTNRNREAQLARHQILATLEDFLSAAVFAVKNGGTVSFIYPAELLCEFVFIAQKCRLEVKKIQLVYSYPHKSAPARLALVQCLKNGGTGSEILPPLYIYCQKNGEFSSEMQQFYRKN
ncbi:tRNA1(Val) (adenine(37)-N6)-methyltransferase [Desulfocastanea catecholica]